MNENLSGRGPLDPENRDLDGAVPADYTTPGEPMDARQRLVEEEHSDATTGNPLDEDDVAPEDADYITVGNPIRDPEHLEEEEYRHATTGVPLEDDLEEDDDNL